MRLIFERVLYSRASYNRENTVSFHFCLMASLQEIYWVSLFQLLSVFINRECLFVTEATPKCHDGLQTSNLAMTRELGQSPINVSATYDGKCSQNQFLQFLILINPWAS